MPEVYSAQKTATELRKQFSDRTKRVRVRMKYSKEVGRFLKKIKSAHKSTDESELIFK